MKRRLSVGCLAVALAVAAPTRAQLSGAERASAEALFNEGVTLVAAKSYAEGCRKFEASQALDPTLGTELRLADCYERWGKTASAWGSFKHAQGVARVRNQTEREELARQRVEALEPKLSYLSIEIGSEPMPTGLVVERDGNAVSLASLGVSIPVDPGEHLVTVRAEGFEPWQETLTIAPGPGKYSVRIPALRPRAPTPVAAEPPPAGPPPPPPARLVVAAPPVPPPVDGVQRTAGLVTGAAGLTSILVSAGLGFYALREGERSKESAYCPTDDNNGCTAEGVELRDRARSFGTAATVTFLAGAALVTTGVVLYSTAPEAGRGTARHRLELRASALPGSFGTSLRGSW